MDEMGSLRAPTRGDEIGAHFNAGALQRLLCARWLGILRCQAPDQSATRKCVERSCVALAELRRLAAAVRPRVTMTARVEGASGSKMQVLDLRAVPRLRGSPSLASCLAK